MAPVSSSLEGESAHYVEGSAMRVWSLGAAGTASMVQLPHAHEAPTNDEAQTSNTPEVGKQ